MNNILLHCRFLLTLLFALWSSGASALDNYYQYLGEDVRIYSDIKTCHQASKKASENYRKFTKHELKVGSRMCLHVPFTLKGQSHVDLTLRASMLASYEIALNGNIIERNGKQAAKAEEEVVGLTDTWVNLSNIDSGSEQLISILLSNHNLNADFKSPLFDLYLIDTPRFNKSQKSRLVLPLMLSGALGLISCFFILAFCFYERHKKYLLVAALCLTGTLLLLAEESRHLLTYLYTDHIIRLQAITLLTAVACWLLQSVYLSLFKVPHQNKWHLGILIFIATVLLLPTSYDAKAILMFFGALVIALIIVIVATRNGLKGSRLNLITLLFGVGLFLYDPLDFGDPWFGVVFTLIVLSILVSVTQQIGEQRQLAIKSQQLENQLLKKSIQPHFLMNSLSLLTELYEDDPKQAGIFIESLAKEFRLMNQYANEPLITLEQELELCENLLAIMSCRQQKTFHLVVKGSKAGVKVPPATIHTLIENAFSHSRVPDQSNFVLNIENSLMKTVLCFSAPFSGSKVHKGTGTGLAYVNMSIQNAFGEQADISSAPIDNAWVTTLTLGNHS